MKKLLLLIFVSLCAVTNANAQIFLEKDVADLLDGNLLEMGSWQAASQAVIQQIGDANNFTSIQQNADLLNNKVLSSQQGRGNMGYISQTGSSLKTSLQQTGQSNEASIWQEGSLISLEARQTGDGNVITSYIKNMGLFDKTVALLQEGNNNRIDIALFGDEIPSTSQAIRVTQQGNGFEAKASMESYNFPVEITQRAGTRGGEMKVDVSTSYFSFPMK